MAPERRTLEVADDPFFSREIATQKLAINGPQQMRKTRCVQLREDLEFDE